MSLEIVRESVCEAIIGEDPSASLRAAMLIFLETSDAGAGKGKLCDDCIFVAGRAASLGCGMMLCKDKRVRDDVVRSYVVTKSSR